MSCLSIANSIYFNALEWGTNYNTKGWGKMNQRWSLDALYTSFESAEFKADYERFGKEIAPLILTGPPGVTGFAGGRAKPKEVIAYWPALIPKNLVDATVKIMEV